ncbi:zf-HC2 domain-containing protein [Streptomyces sp. NPDC053048]
MDGEELPPGIGGTALDGHLDECAECRGWAERARRLRALAAALDLA